MTDTYLLSIVVPVYNVETVITPLVRQLVELARTERVELVFVDDGATDTSTAKVAALIATTPSAKLLHQVNAGLSAARNHGLDVASGEYVWFIDGDDLINMQLLPALLATLKRDHPDLMQFGYVNFTTQPDFEAPPLHWRQVSGQALFAELAENHLQNYAWAHICLRRLYREAAVRFPEGLQFEDMPTTYKLFLASQTALVTTAPIYGYRKRADSIVNVVSEQSMQDLWTIAKLVGTETGTLHDRQHASQLREMAQLIALGRTMEGNDSSEALALRREIIKTYRHTSWEHRGAARLKTRLRQFMMAVHVYVPINRRRLRARL